ncbi:thioester reductase-like protein [Rhodococcus sp. LBL1]|nr:thioester reductase-like protein [Rhodococcus sp. LBL1]MDH6681623.1 thioester reductase-like protein [Rhodococcus sp. LBL2]
MKRTLLLTGGSGVIGRAMLDAMAADFDIVCLRGRRPIDDPRVSEFAGDFTHPTLGLSAADYSRLADRVDVVLHGAAVTKWNVDPERLRAVNVQGPASMLRLAADADAPLYYLSTAFVIRQAPSDERFAGLTAYLESKTEAEELVRAGSVPAVIVRPSVVTGDSRDGSIAAFQGLHRMLGNAIRGNIPVVPGDIRSLVDAVPLDIVVDAVGKLIRERVTGGEYWLTAGDEALTFTDIAEVCEDVSRLVEVGATRPRFMPFESVDRLLMPLLDELIPDGRRQMLTDFLESVWVFQSSEAMPSDLDRLGFGDRATREALTEALRRSLIYWAQVKKLLPVERQLAESVV